MGQVAFLHPPETACLRCLFPEGVPKRKFPVVGATPGVIGTIQAMEVLKHLTGLGAGLKGWLLLFDGQGMEFIPIKVLAAPSCPVCGSPEPGDRD
jgi:adenylyltransferase/sulfurtransferase